MMTLVKIIGGLGNQMFQYAFAYALAEKNQKEVKLDISGFKVYDLRNYELNIFNISLPLASEKEIRELKYKSENIVKKVFRKLARKPLDISERYYIEPYFHFDEKVFNINGYDYFDGYWQSEKYFMDYRDKIIKEFTLKNKLSLESQKYLEKIRVSNSVSLHIRRGDYISNSAVNKKHGTCGIEYYHNAIGLIKEKIKNPIFFIFSDDLLWCKENLTITENQVFVELSKEVHDSEEMYLLSQCKHNIIANSSFSWWGAWLNQNNTKIVIAPETWFKDGSKDTRDLIPDRWIRL